MLIFFFPLFLFIIFFFMLPTMCKLEIASENETKRNKTESRREEAAQKLRVCMHVVQICYLWIFFFSFLVAPWVGGCPSPKSCWAYPGTNPNCTDVGVEKRGLRESCRLQLCFVASIIRESLWNLILFYLFIYYYLVF